MKFTRDMLELLDLFKQHGVSYLLVGGYAVNYYGYSRLTQDIDFLILPSADNADRLRRTLADFGFAGANLPWDLLEKEGVAIHLGVEPNRIDILTSLKGVPNEQLFANGRKTQIDGISLSIIAYEDLLAVKLSSKRPRDQADAFELKRIHEKKDR